MPKNKLIIVFVLFAGIVVGVFMGRVALPKGVGSLCVSSLKFIKPNLDCDVSESKAQTFSVLQDKLEVIIEGYKKSNKAKRVSIFVRDLNTSRFVGVDDGDVYYMASLLKTPLLIGGFKLAEVEPKILDQDIVYTGKPDLYGEQVIKAGDTLKVGESYSIKELMRRSVVYSDNIAAQLLFDYYPQEFMDRILQALGIQLTKLTGEKENLITARTYANVFRVLYNASYLTKEYSDEALDMLTKTSFDKGATAKLPKEVVVAHKFAERSVVDLSGTVITKQLHECGIVYAKDYSEPYSFCLMTEGSDYADLEEVLSNISLIIYDEMISR